MPTAGGGGGTGDDAGGIGVTTWLRSPSIPHGYSDVSMRK